MILKRRKVFIAFLAILLCLSTVTWAKGADEDVSGGPAAAAPKMVKDPATGKMVKPQYGGTITFVLGTAPMHTDVEWNAPVNSIALVVEMLGIADWALDRKVFAYDSSFVSSEFARGHLAESYETPDPLTIIFHIRKGIHWQNKPPMNGRELTAHDVVFNLHRYTGLGSGFTKPLATASEISVLPIASVSASDDWTVVVKLKTPSRGALNKLFYDSVHPWILPPEVIKQYGDHRDWRHVVGTGPYMLTSWQEGSSIGYTRNPNYWKDDEKFPGNRLPYADEVKMLIIPDVATRFAALRTGKVDILGGCAFPDTDINLEQAENLKKTNPELLSSVRMERSYQSYAMDVRKRPFSDIRVRQAMQLALDNEEINKTYYRGAADPTPFGIVGAACIGYYTPYSEWPDEVKKNYGYDPERAKKLLAEAGYPNGFSTSLDAIQGGFIMDLDHVQIVKDYWKKIGVDVNINMVENMAALFARIRNGTYDGMTWGERGTSGPVDIELSFWTTGNDLNQPQVSDPEYDRLFKAFDSAKTVEEQKKWAKEADMYSIKQQWNVWGPRPPVYTFYQPWLGGYNGELRLGGGWMVSILSRLWVDQDLKKQMGH
jgi:peptide/nickel transport system substrate-binding protein